MPRLHQWIGLAFLSVALTGCVAREKYDALKLERDQLSTQLNSAESKVAAANAERDALRKQIDGLMAKDPTAQAMLNNLMQENGLLKGDLEKLRGQLADALKNQNMGGGPLPGPLSNALTQFAQQNPDLVDFDAARGVVKFKSDVTFALGSAELTPKAKDVIGRFAQILNSPAAANYELQVAGHTDNTRVANQATIAKGHKDNWYLSAHRAISVSEELQASRVSSARLAVVGYADQRPIASNGSDIGRGQNRRVEVLILPTTVRGGSGGSSTPVAAPRLNKDETPARPAAPARPVLNK